MTAKWIETALETVIGPLEQKKQYKQTKARIKALPEPYRTAAEACHRYTMYSGRITDGDTLMQMYADLADLFEGAAADATPLRDILGDDPVEFAETFADAYLGKQWIDKERARLRTTIAGLDIPDRTDKDPEQ